jgi:dihydrofolate synthase/folylpolyglutamate synthase
VQDASNKKLPASVFQLTCDYLYSLRNKGSKYGLARTEAFLAKIGNPERAFPVIHVAGTNGKGSVCAMLEALYRQNRYKTGFFNSPHLIHLGERIQINREPLSEDAILDWVDTFKSSAEALAHESPELEPTFFEYMAAMAFAAFARAKVDLALIETGLGGRLDATNVVDPELSIITSISLDHTDLLGDTLSAIAREKGGIIKQSKPVLFGKLPPEAVRVLRGIADERGSKVYAIEDRFPDISTLPKTNLHGIYQRWNAGLAIYATEILAEKFPAPDHSALNQINWQGRWQKIELEDRTLILDATHNPEGAHYLKENLKGLTSPPIIITGTLGDERALALMETIAPFARELILVKPNQPRATSTETLRKAIPETFAGTIKEGDLHKIFPKAKCCTVGKTGDTIVITGSIYLIGEILTFLQGDTVTKINFQDRL